ncbi:NAD(P)/FAD-dependent oxidoreductase [Streptomyces sp. ISL-11]|uniref:NAD(P)/FAD-dependent oxidoreductase n=1 Tax=Streptomyces sp. ISL-11 TaxID=2819174 RepID=UPI001BECCE91|nr:FAD-dependent oxidoreductase [Streptomyces sp. ISL-11]MBT2386280.1 NAD(P)/FAD-dependent oxidoreductase [Streptomyces sp. ISL-11]
MTGRIAVVGAGMAAARFAERFHALGGRGEVTLYGAEPGVPYNRVLLADVLAGRYAAEAVGLPYGEGVVRAGGAVAGVDVGARTLRLADGSDASYDELVLATGAEPVLPRVRGLRGAGGGLRDGVHAFRTLADCRRLAGEAAGAERAVVVGGGVLGVGVARALAALGLSVRIVYRGPHLVERQLDEQAGTMLRSGLADLGVGTLRDACGALLPHPAPSRDRGSAPDPGPRSPDGPDQARPGRVTGVELASGTVLDADLVVVACGVRPRTRLARAAGLPVRTGILVDDTLACAPGVYAIGDCAEHRGVTHGLAGPAWAQADVLAARLSGADPDAAYTGSRPYTRLTAGPLEYAAFGETAEGGPGLDVLRLTDATRGSYKKLVVRGDRLVGGILLGDLATVGALSRAYQRDDPLPADPLHLLTTQGAS